MRRPPSRGEGLALGWARDYTPGVFPAVVVDLGSQIRPAEAAWILAACNAAIVRGTCELEAAADTPSRAVAIVRLQGSGQRVRIEVGLRESERDAWSVREIAFAPADPTRERWRTVGLALATLVGEVEAANAETSAPASSGSLDGTPPGLAEPSPSAADGGAAPAAQAGPAPPSAGQPTAQPAPSVPEAPEALPEPLEPAPARRVVVSERDAARRAPAFPSHHGVFVGFGVLAGPAATGGTMPWGGALRGGYTLPSGWVFALNADYSRAEFEPDDYALDTLRLTPGIGYRLSPAEHWSIGLAASAGVRALWASSARAGGVQQNAWSPLVTGSLELWWQALRAGGLWAALELRTIGRTTRVRGLDAALDPVVPAADVRAFIGFWAAL